MNKHLLCLLTLSVLFLGCASSKVSMSNGMPQNFTYPVTDNAFLNDAIARHNVDSRQDLLALFTALAPEKVDLCGLSPEMISSKFLIDEAEAEKNAKKAAKSLLRQGIEGSSKTTTDPRDYKILASTCPSPGATGSVTIRFSTDTESNIGGNITKTHISQIGILSFGQDLQPTLMGIVTKLDRDDIPPSLSYSAMGDKYTNGKLLLANFNKILDYENVTLYETDNNEVTTASTWTGGKLKSIGHSKGGKIHGEMIVFAQTVAGTDIPESRICYKKGAVVKTTGPCLVD